MKIKTIALSIVLLSCNLIISQSKLIREVCLTNNEHNDRYASYSPNGEGIIYESDRHGNWEIFFMDLITKKERRITANTTDDRRPSWHPNGKKIIFESNRNGQNELYSANIKNGKVKKIKTELKDGELIFASYSPNGKKIAVSYRESEGKSNIILLTKNGKLDRWLTHEERRSFYPKWSPNGDEIVYFSRKETDNEDDEIYRLHLENGTELRLTEWPKHNFCPSWSNDGKMMVYVTSMEDIRPEIYVMKADGSQKTRITTNEDGDTLPIWHPHENKILITGYRNGNFEICELELD